jgi:hypothetical protein
VRLGPTVLPFTLAALLWIQGAAGEAGQAGGHDAGALDVEHTRSALVAAGDPDALETAALLRPASGDDPASRLALIARAAAAAPERADLVWWQLRLCSELSSCDPAPLETRLRKLDPGNGAAWTGSLERSTSLRDQARVAAALSGIAHSQRYDVYWNLTVLRTAKALMRAGGMDPGTAVTTAIGAVAAAFPSYQSISDACRGPVLLQPAWRTSCRGVAEVMRHGDTSLTEMFGLGLAQRLAAPGGGDYQAAAEARRVANERRRSIGRLGGPFPRDRAAAERYLKLLATHRTEQEVLDAQISAAGVMKAAPDRHPR